MRMVASYPLVRPFAGALLAHDLPGLDHDRADLAVRFVSGRVDVMPSPTRAGVLVVAVATRILMALPMRRRLVAIVASHRIPIAGEYVRLIRSLAYAYVWETWPRSQADGGAALERA